MLLRTFFSEGELFGFGSDYSKRRYDVLFDIYSRNEGRLSEQDVKTVLQEVRSSNGNEPEWVTQSSVIFNQSTGAATYYLHENFEEKYIFLPNK